MKSELSFVFHKEKCIQCHGCEVACRVNQPTEVHIYRRRVENQWEGAYPNVKCSTVNTSCRHCVEPECMEICPVNAISKDPETGAVSVDVELCVGCRACERVCPWGVPQFREDRKMDKCSICDPNPPCVRDCPTDALELVWMDVEEKKNYEK